MSDAELRLLQIPNFTEKHVEACKGQSPSITTIREFLALQPDERRRRFRALEGLESSY